ncbi:MAG TPA: tRNA (N6-threonylcarbamoyladenosine(37)-N6)-methyltransferase TrmO [Dehalococcoidia bacterium]|nr:tRNA (N6-threonylcarbamoyladenosine(37)-N6)-methyltransferase TrmO [Dehalococcoidia bacterium]
MLERIRRLLSRWPVGAVREPPLQELPSVTLRPIGVVRNGVRDTAQRDWREVTSRIVVRPELADALLGLDSYSHVFVLFWPHRVPESVRGAKHRLHPLDDPQYPLQGVLATRSQIRFNPVLVTAVPLLGVKGNVLRVRGLDAIDGTPVLDIKPYIPYYDSLPEAKVPPWVIERAAQARRAGHKS